MMRNWKNKKGYTFSRSEHTKGKGKDNRIEKPVKCITNGKKYKSRQAAADALGLSASHIGTHLKGRSKDVKGYTFLELPIRKPKNLNPFEEAQRLQRINQITLNQNT